MKTTTDGKWAFKVLAGNFISEEDLESLGISADWHLYLSPTEPPSAAQCNQQMNAYDLSACPCCGGRATIIGTLKTCEWSAICTMCGLETAHMMQPRDAASAWNKRHAPDEGPAGIKTPEPNQMDAMLTDKPQNATIVPCDVCRQPNRIGHDCTPPESGGQGECKCLFDAWQKNPYTVTLMKSVREDYQPKASDGEYVAAMVERIKAAERRIVDGHAPRRIPADPTDVDLVLAEVHDYLTGKPRPFWVASLAQGGGNER